MDNPEISATFGILDENKKTQNITQKTKIMSHIYSTEKPEVTPGAREG